MQWMRYFSFWDLPLVLLRYSRPSFIINNLDHIVFLQTGSVGNVFISISSKIKDPLEFISQLL